MQLQHMRHLPTRAGAASIEFFDGRENEQIIPFDPVRRGELIYLPYHPEADFIDIAGGRQFLYALPDRWWSEPVWFGGEDEAPFLAQLTRAPLRAHQEAGERGFLESLKPLPIQRLEAAFQRLSLRQGDIFAFPLQRDWGAVVQAEESRGNRVEPYSGMTLVYGTRHRISGTRATKPGTDLVLAEGVLTAPDHAPRNLTGVHVLDQASGLASPLQAD